MWEHFFGAREVVMLLVVLAAFAIKKFGQL
jgi:hypothetical protein